MPSLKEIPQNKEQILSHAETMVFLRGHLPIKEIMTVTRERFTNIDSILSEAQINKHDQGHQLRTAVHAAQAMHQLGFSHREIMQATSGALIHDVGYNKRDEAEDDSLDGYNVGTKAQFKKHALKGALEVEESLRAMLAAVREQGDDNPTLKRLVSYKDENGEMQTLDEEDVKKIVEAILNHNDYGKDNANYDPHEISKGALMVQLFDKLDICRKRVYPEHMDPGAFVEDSKDYDPKYFHRVAPYCVQSYEHQIDPETGTMEMVYKVDLAEFRALMQKSHPDFRYSEADFTSDFQRAYTKNCRIAAEAVGVILDNPTNQATLTVKLDFGNDRVEDLEFARPNREIYEEQTRSLRATIAEMVEERQRAA
jgi:hypothetical protein